MQRQVFATAFILGSMFAGLLPAQQPQASPVVVSPVEEKLTRELKMYVGTILPLKRAVVGSAVDGRVTDVFIDVGDRVEVQENGLAPLAQLLTETIKLEYEAAQAELVLRQQELSELQTGARPEEKDQAQAQLLGAQAMMEFTQARAKRNQALYKQSQGISPDEVEESMAAAERSSQAFAEARANYDLVAAGPREERKAQAAARVEVQRALADQIGDRIKKYTVVSRFSGYVVSKLAEEGQWLKQGDPVAEIVHLDQVEVEVHVVEQSINLIRVGTKVQVEISSASAQPFEGVVSAIVPQADVRTRTFPVRILIQNQFEGKEPVIKSGMFARTKLPTGGSQPSILVPKDALVLGGPQPMVYKVVAGKTVPVPLVLGNGYGKQIQVTGALRAGDQVVVVGNERLRPGQDVEVVRTIAISNDSGADSAAAPVGGGRE